MNEGMKFDRGKTQYSLVPPRALHDLAEVMTYGADKYAPDNWRKVDDPENRYYNALMRHLEAYRRGEGVDPESGLPHLAHVMANATFLLEFYYVPE
jgi:hypothetical protein